MITTVNVFELSADEGVLTFASWADDISGNQSAEERFKSLILEHDGDTPIEDVNDYLDAGHYSQDDYAIFLVHSTETEI